VIKPLHKGGDPTNINNYRPISLLSNFSKIFEKIIKSRLIAYLEGNKLLSKNQFGFRPGIGTEEALYNTTTFLYNELDKSNKVIAVFLDLTKAFDTVNHQILLEILRSFGINNNSWNWFRSYIFNRTQIVKINITGNECSIEYGVPQGSVLGPILFNLYVNSICECNLDGLIVAYADDTCLLFSDKSLEGAHSKATVGLNNVNKSLSSRQLTLNNDKTVFMTFSIYKSKTNFNKITIHSCSDKKFCNQDKCKSIKMVSKIQYLGIIFDKNLRWDSHIHNLVGKLRSISYKFT
jgi:hypothetical protein